MSARLLPTLALFPALALGVAACPTGGADDDDSTASDDDDDDDDATDDDDDATPEFGGTVGGVIQDSDGNAISNFRVTLCATEGCVDTTTDAGGAYLFDNVAPNRFVLENLFVPPGTSAADWSRFFVFVDVDEDEQEDTGTLVLPVIENAQRDLAGAQDLDLGAGLRVRFDADATDANPLMDDEIALGARALPRADWPIEGTEGWTVHAAYALAPWDQHGAFEAEVTLPEALGEGLEVAFLQADYDHGLKTDAFKVFAAELDEGRTVVTSAAGSELELSTLWMVASRAAR